MPGDGQGTPRSQPAPNFRELVWEIVRAIPRGSVMTYGQIAALTGAARGARAVGWVLYYTPREARVPCQRVVNRFGGLASVYGIHGLESHKVDLLEDGVEVREDYTIDLQRYRWTPTAELVETWALAGIRLRA